MEWTSVSELPPEAYMQQKPAEKAWIVTNGKRIWVETLHPSSWNLTHNKGKAMEWRVDITHWAELPELPKV